MTAKNPDNRWTICDWQTVAVTALPAGWRNIYRQNDGTVMTTTCPAILLQEGRGEIVSWDEQQDGRIVRRSREEKFDPPFLTRAVFADCDRAELLPADDASNYEQTLGPGEDYDEGDNHVR